MNRQHTSCQTGDVHIGILRVVVSQPTANLALFHRVVNRILEKYQFFSICAHVNFPLYLPRQAAPQF